MKAAIFYLPEELWWENSGVLPLPVGKALFFAFPNDP